MSDTAILETIATILIEKFPNDWNDDNCQPRSSGDPPPMMGDRFAAVHMTSISGNGYQENATIETYNFAITVTKRIHAVPESKITRSVYLGTLQEISPMINRIIHVISNRWSITNRINDALTVDPFLSSYATPSAFISPPVFLSRTPTPVVRDEDWFHGTHGPKLRDLQDGHVGLSLTATFGNLNKETIIVEEDCS